MSDQQPQPMPDEDQRRVDGHVAQHFGVEKEGAPPAPASFFGVEVPRPAEPPTEARVLR